MGFITPFIIGAVVGVASSWGYQRRKSNEKSPPYSPPPTASSEAAMQEGAVQEGASSANGTSEAAPAE